MQDSNEKVVIFPKWKTRLEKESLDALQKRNYEEALSKIEKLISYDILNHELAVGKLICLMELGRYNEAESFNEQLLFEKNNYYYHYLHIYLTILLHTNQFEPLVKLVEQELDEGNIPVGIKEQFLELYHIGKKLLKDYHDEKSIELSEELTEAIEKKDYTKQWYIIESLRKTDSQPTLTMIQYLKEDEIHPIVKTAIFNWLQDVKIDDEVEVSKLGLQISINPKHVAEIREGITFRQIMLCIRDVEQENPTLYKLLEKLLYRYAYVRYPIMPPSQDSLVIANALKGIGQQYLYEEGQEWEDSVQKYMDELRMCETLYLSVIEE